MCLYLYVLYKCIILLKYNIDNLLLFQIIVIVLYCLFRNIISLFYFKVVLFVYRYIGLFYI